MVYSYYLLYSRYYRMHEPYNFCMHNITFVRTIIKGFIYDIKIVDRNDEVTSVTIKCSFKLLPSKMDTLNNKDGYFG